MRKSGSVLIESLEPVRPGSAAEVHLGAAVDGFNSAGLTVRTLCRSSSGSRVWTIFADQFRAAAMSRNVGYIYSRWHVLGCIQYLAYWLSGRPYVLEVNGTTEDIVLAHPQLARFRRVLDGVARWQFRHASGIVAVTIGHGRWAQALAGRRKAVCVVPNGANGSIATLRRNADVPRYVVFLGELAPWQGVDCLLRAVNSPKWPRDVRLVVIGDGAMRKAVERAAYRGDVDYLGRLPRDSALAVLAGASASLSPQSGRFDRNRVGVSPIKVAESIMLGVPPIVSDLPGQSGLVSEAPAGSVFPADDPQELAIAVKRVCQARTEDREALAQFGQERVRWDVIFQRVAEFCANVVARSGRA